jgi:hypothetical protein
MNMWSHSAEAGYKTETCDIRERDIDLLLIEELYSSPLSREHFLSLLRGEVPNTANFIAARHSVSCSLGQSDVELELQVGEERWILMIENKIDASFQPDQAKRYTQRGEQHILSGYTKFFTILIAPAAYLGRDTYGFDLAVSYE